MAGLADDCVRGTSCLCLDGTLDHQQEGVQVSYFLHKGEEFHKAGDFQRKFPIEPPFTVPEDGWYAIKLDYKNERAEIVGPLNEPRSVKEASK